MVITAVLFVVLTVGVFMYYNFEKKMHSIAQEKAVAQAELFKAKQEYDNTLEKLDSISKSEAKEMKIREKLNMIKKDEIQFTFTDVDN